MFLLRGAMPALSLLMPLLAPAQTAPPNLPAPLAHWVGGEQSREAHFFWNPQSQRIEFLDHLDQGGGHVRGVLEVKDGLIAMDVAVVANSGHPAWRAWIKESGDDQELRVDALRDGRWGLFGTYPYKHVR